MARRISTSNQATTSVVSAFTTASVAPAASVANSPLSVKTLACGALSATPNTLKSLLAISGRGRLTYLSCYTADTTSRTIRVVVTVDSVTAVDVTSAATTTSGAGLVICGITNYSTGSVPSSIATITFNASIDVSIASSVATDTDKLIIGYLYELE